MSLLRAGWFTSVPYIFAMVLGLLVGKLSDSLLIVFILLSGAVLLTNMFANEYLRLVLLALCLVCISSALPLNIALTDDLVWNPEMVGTAMGFLILGGEIFGSLVPIATGYIVKWTGSFDLAFYLAGFLLLVSAVACFTMTQKPLSLQENAA